jgi:hypothetical protein
LIVYAEESLNVCRPDIASMLPAQWSETGDDFANVRPNWQLYEKLEKARKLIVVMAREDGRPIGYLTGVVYPHPNQTEEIIGSIPTYFIERRSGRALMLRSLIAKGIDVALKRGAWKVLVKTEYNHSAGRILEAMGMVPTAVEYAMMRQERRYA